MQFKVRKVVDGPHTRIMFDPLSGHFPCGPVLFGNDRDPVIDWFPPPRTQSKDTKLKSRRLTILILSRNMPENPWSATTMMTMANTTTTTMITNTIISATMMNTDDDDNDCYYDDDDDDEHYNDDDESTSVILSYLWTWPRSQHQLQSREDALSCLAMNCPTHTTFVTMNTRIFLTLLGYSKHQAMSTLTQY